MTTRSKSGRPTNPESSRYYIGTISGTSLDGIDLALLKVTAQNTTTIVAGHTEPFDPALQEQLRAIALAEIDDIDSMGHADVTTGRAIGMAVLAFLNKVGLEPGEVRAVGSHGQTVRHRPGGNNPFTLQLGDPNVIAELTGITTVADFRRRDMAAGGEAAPLVPLFHQALFASDTEDRVVLNIGGIANITTLRAGQPPRGFDTGPGNALMDAWVQANLGRQYDANGAWQNKGSLNPELLATFLQDAYFAAKPPKSTGKEHFNQIWLDQHLDDHLPPNAADVQATLAQLTAVSIAHAIERWSTRAGPVITCGGGRLNPPLIDKLAAQLPNHHVCASESLGVNGDWLEAAAFAYLAHRRLEGLPGNVPTVTGAAGERVLGGVYFP